MSDFDLAGVLRRIRRLADLSQRQLAEKAALSKSAVASAEAGTRDLPSTHLARAAGVAGLRLTLLDSDGQEVTAMSPDGARDAGHRRFPAHLDTMHSAELPSRWEHNPGRPQPWFSFMLDRGSRDRDRACRGVPDDHHVPQPGDSPQDRAAERRRAYWRHRAEERERRFLAGEFAGVDLGFVCDCPPGCDELDIGERPVHVRDCPCSCDLG